MMTNTSYRRYALALLLLLGLFGCDRKSVPPSPTPASAPATSAATTKLSGHVTAPPGLFDQPPTQARVGWLDRLLISPAYAFVGVAALGNVTVGVWTSDAFGVAVGSPIATAQTDVDGYYELPLPPTYVVSPSLVVRVGDDDCHLRRIVTGVSYQDVSLSTEIGLQVVLAQTDTYPVDVRVIPPTQFETVYTTVDHECHDYDVRPVLLQVKGPRKVVFEHACNEVNGQIRARPAAWTTVRETVHGSYEVAREQGRGVLVVHRDGRPVASSGPVEPKHEPQRAQTAPEPEHSRPPHAEQRGGGDQPHSEKGGHEREPAKGPKGGGERPHAEHGGGGGQPHSEKGGGHGEGKKG